jgi:hypothetical protein
MNLHFYDHSLSRPLLFRLLSSSSLSLLHIRINNFLSLSCSNVHNLFLQLSPAMEVVKVFYWKNLNTSKSHDINFLHLPELIFTKLPAINLHQIHPTSVCVRLWHTAIKNEVKKIFIFLIMALMTHELRNLRLSLTSFLLASPFAFPTLYFLSPLHPTPSLILSLVVDHLEQHTAHTI